MSIQRGCQFCGQRLRGIVPGAMTILLDGEPIDCAIVICPQHTMELRRVLDYLRQRSTVAQRARGNDTTEQISKVVTAPTELFPKVVVAERFEQEAHGTWPPQIPVPLQPRRLRDRVWRGERPSY